MYNQLKIIIGFVCLFVIYGCTDLNIYSDFDEQIDFSIYNTYKICIEDLEVGHKNFPDYDNNFNRNRIKNAIEYEMNKIGYQLDEINPEIQVGFQIIIKDQQMSVKSCSGIGVYDYWPQCWINTYEYTEGSLLIYISEIQKNQIIWQGSASAVLNIEPQKLKKNIAKIVGQIFKGYPTKKELKKTNELYDYSKND
jgi:hypothetical protein